MPNDVHRRAEPKTQTLRVESAWTPGRRTLAWETLWRHILADALSDLSDAARTHRRSAGADAAEPAGDGGAMDGPRAQGAAGS